MHRVEVPARLRFSGEAPRPRATCPCCGADMGPTKAPGTSKICEPCVAEYEEEIRDRRRQKEFDREAGGDE